MNDHDRNRFRLFVRAGLGPASLPPEMPWPAAAFASRPARIQTSTVEPERREARDVERPRAGAAMPPARPARPGGIRPRHLRLVTRLERPGTDEDGFSLLELLVVVAILGILVAAALPRFAEFRAAAYDSRSQQDLRNLAAAEELYRATSPTYADDTALLSGFAASEGVEVALESADETGFIATATHPAGARDFRWDSSADPPLSSAAR